MKKFINAADKVVDEMLEGILLAHPDELRTVREDNKAIVRVGSPKEGKVGIITGGGSGHLPLFLGYVGRGMLDGVAVGDVFQSPSPGQIFDVIQHVNGNAGVLFIYGNYGGDVFNFDMAAELAEEAGIETRTVLGSDDVASMPKEQASERRGVAGIFYLYKCAGAAAEKGCDLAETTRIAAKAGSRVRTMGVALSPCIIPIVGKPGFTIDENTMEVGMGIHGEPGIEKSAIKRADETSLLLVEKILNDMEVQANDEVSVLINGLGATPLEELYIIFRNVHKILTGQGIRIDSVFIGEYATSMEMAGLSISILHLDAELKALWNEPFDTPFHRRLGSEGRG